MGGGGSVGQPRSSRCCASATAAAASASQSCGAPAARSSRPSTDRHRSASAGVHAAKPLRVCFTLRGQTHMDVGVNPCCTRAHREVIGQVCWRQHALRQAPFVLHRS